jgi:photosystem II stability/assembly factor-like uncharacterized protein
MRTSAACKLWWFTLNILFPSAYPVSAQWHYSYYHNPPHRFDECEALDTSTFWVSGAYGHIIKSTDAGRTWSENYGPIGNDYDFYELDFAGPKFGWAATGYFSPVKLVATADFGESWQLISDSLDLSWISDMEFVDSLNGFASGSWMVRRSTDGGFTRLSPDSFVDGLTISDLEPLNKDTVWASGYLGQGPLAPAVAKTQDGGRTWQLVIILDDTLDAWAPAIKFADTRHGWVTINSIESNPCPLYATMDAGESWIFLHEFDEGTTINDFNNFVAFDSFDVRVAAYIGGGFGIIKRSTDGGLTWDDEFVGSTGLVKGYVMPDSTHGLVVGGPVSGFSPLLLYYDYATDIIDGNIPELPAKFQVSEAYPNPFNHPALGMHLKSPRK